MNKSLFYLLVTIIGLVTLTIIWYPAMDEQTTPVTATPANGLVGDTTEEATTKAAEEPAAPAPAQEAAPAPVSEAPQDPAGNGDEVAEEADEAAEEEEDEDE